MSTKVGRWLTPAPPDSFDHDIWVGPLDMAPTFDYTYDGFMRSVEQSLHRLATHRLDVLLIHDADVVHHGERIDEVFKTALDSDYCAVDELRRNGDVRAIGVGVNEAEMCARFARAGDFDCMLLAGRYTLYEQGALDEFLPLVVEKDIGIIIGGAFNSGILTSGRPMPRPMIMFRRQKRCGQRCAGSRPCAGGTACLSPRRPYSSPSAIGR